MFENIVLSLESVFAHKVRSLLTMLGIIIGIASIITIVSTIKGTSEEIKENLVGSGVNAVVVKLYENDYEYEPGYSSLPQGVAPVTQGVLTRLREIDRVKAVSAYHQRSWCDGVYYRNTAYTGSMLGVDENYLALYGYTVRSGRLFSESEIKNAGKVLVIDSTAARVLFAGEDALGRVVEISGEPFTVVGVVEQKDASKPVIRSLSDYEAFTDQSGGKCFMPDSAWPVAFRFDEPASVALGTVAPDDMTVVGQKAAEILTSSLVSGKDYSYRSEDLLKQARQLQELSTATSRQLIWIAGISLLVGGIGVMNIMLVTVTERTREIGLKKAIGAKKSRILAQFLTEAAVLTTLGGIIGVIAGLILAKVLSAVMETPAAISFPAILIAVAFSVVIGLIFGLIPAAKAAGLDPIEALRRE